MASDREGAGVITRFLERIGVLKPRYVAGWPRGVRPIAGNLNLRLAHDMPEVWARVRHLPAVQGYEELCAGFPGLWEQVRGMSVTQGVNRIERELFGDR